MTEEQKPKPNFLWSVVTMRCPRCRRGDMFKNSNPFKKLKLDYILDMHDDCPVCHQKFDLEPGFWYGTGYVSYGLFVLFSAVTFGLWCLLIGVSTDDNRVVYWLVINAVAILILQPWFMRLSRVVYLLFFVSYNENYDKEKGTTFDY
ncbi:MAG: DUF983 domain-containing protein [Bacteroidota bacterium]|nr:DUF983 domain-containing protein [Bacteroidota bacterium]